MWIGHRKEIRALVIRRSEAILSDEKKNYLRYE